MLVPGDTHHERLRDEDDELLQFAIQQSLVQSGSEEDQVCMTALWLWWMGSEGAGAMADEV